MTSSEKNGYTAHDQAKILLLRKGPELGESLKQNGLLEEIVPLEGKVLDGRRNDFALRPTSTLGQAVKAHTDADVRTPFVSVFCARCEQIGPVKGCEACSKRWPGRRKRKSRSQPDAEMITQELSKAGHHLYQYAHSRGELKHPLFLELVDLIAKTHDAWARYRDAGNRRTGSQLPSE